jgi:Tfp pilus assembly protein PilF
VGADKHYELAVSADPMNADALGSYASFLHGVIGNMDGAAKYYLQAVRVDLTHANNLCNYGLFLR